MKNKESIQAAHLEAIKKEMFRSDWLPEYPATSCTTITAEAIGEAMEWADALGIVQEENKEWNIYPVYGRTQPFAKTTAELVQLFLNQKAKTMAENLMDGLFSEMNRVRELIKEYEHPALNGAGVFGAAFMKIDIQKAEQAIKDNDVIAMLQCYQALKECN